ncbi:MAG: acetylxylan esterase [Bryobacteraceae bacterium]
MTRRQLFALPPSLVMARLAANAQSGFPGVPYREYARCLPDVLRDLARAAYQRRNNEIAKLTSPAAIRERQKWVRDTFWKLAGGMPERTPLNLRTVGSFERPGYRVEKLIYESFPNFHVTANLYIPAKAKAPLPGVLFQMGHAPNGKAGGTYQRCCQGLVKLGYLVLAFDPMGQGERVYYPNSTGNQSRLDSPDHEHSMAGKQMLLTGDTATRMQAWDAIRSLDVLAAHPLVDPKRLASTGQSGGATLTMLLIAADDRISAAVVCSGNTENVASATYDPPGPTDDAEQNLIGSGPFGFDRWDLLYPFAPKPLLISVSDHDYFGTYSPQYIRNGWEEFQKLRGIYARLDAADRLEWKDTPLLHGLSYDTRLYVYNWFARWLKHEKEPVTAEPEVQPEPDQNLWASESGSTVISFHSETPFSLNRARNTVAKPTPLDRLVGANRPAAGLKPAVLRRIPSRGLWIEAIEVQTAPRVWAPGWLYLPERRDAAKPVILVLEGSGRNHRWHEGELYQTMAQKGYAVCAADVRGVGDLTPEVGRGAPGYTISHAGDDDYTWASLMFGKPLLGQRVTDILALASALRAHPALGGRPLRVAASGRLAIPSLFAAALDPAISSAYLVGGLVSYRSVVETENYSTTFADFVSGILLHTDLPEVAASMAPRKLILAGTLNAAGQPADAGAMRTLYGAREHIVIRPEPKWDLEALIES